MHSRGGDLLKHMEPVSTHIYAIVTRNEEHTVDVVSVREHYRPCVVLGQVAGCVNILTLHLVGFSDRLCA